MKIICIGWNYISHIEEFSGTKPEVPRFFMKPETALLTRNRPFFYPDFSNEIHHEIELVLRINRLGKSISPKFASQYYDAVGLGIDFTARDIQREAIKNGAPWELAKGFDSSALVGDFINKEEIEDLHNIPFSLLRNNELVQQGNSNDLLFHFDALISYISQFVTLKIGDLIFTGTPMGVGPVAINDYLEGYIGDKKMFHCRVK